MEQKTGSTQQIKTRAEVSTELSSTQWSLISGSTPKRKRTAACLGKHYRDDKRNNSCFFNWVSNHLKPVRAVERHNLLDFNKFP